MAQDSLESLTIPNDTEAGEIGDLDIVTSCRTSESGSHA